MRSTRPYTSLVVIALLITMLGRLAALAASVEEEPPAPETALLASKAAVVDAAVAALRHDAGPASVARVLESWAEQGLDVDALPPNATLALDRVCGVRDCARLRLYWHTDFTEALAVARAEDKPILSLRLLGRLDEELSCANSRFFRTVLYADATLAPHLRDDLVLYWESVRPVPKVRFDLGEGQVFERTLQGNSIHYLLDRNGRLVDALPGLYGPGAFRSLLSAGMADADRMASLDDEAFAVATADRHRAEVKRSEATIARFVRNQDRAVAAPGATARPGSLGWILDRVDNRAWAARSDVWLAADPGVERRSARAERRQARAERRRARASQRRALAEPQRVDPSIALASSGDPWAALTQVPGVQVNRTDVGGNDTGSKANVETSALAWIGVESESSTLLRAMASLHTEDATLDASSRHFLRAKHGGDPASHGEVIARFEATIAHDTAINLYRLRPALLTWLTTARLPLDEINRVVYAELFAMSEDDPWLGLAPTGVYAALPSPPASPTVPVAGGGR